MNQMNKDSLPVFMKPKDWMKAYEDGTPHWAVNQEPSPLAPQMLEMLGKGPGNAILEIGVGNGRDSIFFAQKGNEVTGIDIALGAIKMAKKNARAAGVLNRLTFQEGDAERLQFEDSSFDGVYSISVLHATDLKLSLKEIARVLRPQGKALIYLYEKTEKEGREYWFVRKEKIEELLRENNFSIEDTWSFLHEGHPGEKTTVLVFALTKK
ncbi:MAG: class I SAM-dependent methyltransferase [Candidatus Kaiserbacteria bacterium]|nr:class I SAM-dependent methyltransferase [Candidatus Kaiserbacteria bacterium]